VTGGRDLGLAHESHALLGRLVLDTRSGRIGILRAVVWEKPAYGRRRRRRAWLRPEGGGVEWTTAPEAIRAVDP
jgi:hypothetical protein